MSTLLDAAIAIANYCEVADVERGGPSEVSTMIPVKLLDALREAAKTSPHYKDPLLEKREREMIEAYMWEKSPGQGCR